MLRQQHEAREPSRRRVRDTAAGFLFWSGRGDLNPESSSTRCGSSDGRSYSKDSRVTLNTGLRRKE